VRERERERPTTDISFEKFRYTLSQILAVKFQYSLKYNLSVGELAVTGI
jgi:hypothetical protein